MDKCRLPGASAAHCGGAVKVIVSIEDPAVIKRTFDG